jgi:protocatechuate 3,4-dioxygenase beta subunit
VNFNTLAWSIRPSALAQQGGPVTRNYLLASMPLLVFPLAVHSMDCVPTPHRTTGTHYQPVTDQKINISKGISVRGRVLAAPDCTAVANAKVAHWQAGEDGEYVDRLRAYLFTDTNGRYEFETEWPNLFTPHIHFIVTADSYQILETQWIGSKRKNLIEFDMVLQKR